MKKNLIVTLSVIAAATTMMSGCGNRNNNNAEVNNAVLIKVDVAQKELIAQEVEFTANIEAWQTNNIIPALQGARIDRIYVRVGDRVSKGQLVASMDPTQYNQARVQLETLKADLERTKAVHAVGGVSDQVLQQMEAQYDIQKEVVANLAKNVKLYSPTSGVITQRYEEEGNMFTSTPILQIMQMDKLKVKVNVSEQFFKNVRVGTPARLTVDILPGETFEGEVALIYPAIDVATRTFQIEIMIPNTKNRLRPGMFARCNINMGEKEAILISDIAAQKQVGTNERFVFVINDSIAERRMVNVGRTVDGRIDILSGLKEGESVAVTSFSRLSDGAHVEITK